MNVYVFLPLVACLVSALSAMLILMRDPGHRANRIAALLVGGSAWWGVCQVLWTVAPAPEAAWFWHHMAGPGWAFIGPLGLHLVIELTRRPSRRLRRVLPATYSIGASFALLQLGTSWLHGAAMKTPWGWGFEAGPGHKWFLIFTFGCVIPAIWLALSGIRNAPSPAERQQIRLVAIGIVSPFVLAGLTGGILPVLGLQVPRLGSVSFAVFGLVIAWSYQRYGFSALAPGAFSREILETMPNGLALVGLDGVVLTANGQMARLLGIPRADVPGFAIEAALSRSVVSPPEELREEECGLTTAAGERISVSVSTSLLRDKLDLPIGIVIVVRDLREVVELRNHLVTSGRLAAVGELAAGIAHEINNPIAFVRANLAQLDRDWRDLAKRLEPAIDREGRELVDEGEELIAECIEGVERTIRIVQDVKGFARGGTERREAVNLNDLLRSTLRVAHPQLRYRARVECNLGDIPPVLGCAPELQQVFLNLIVNASQAIEGSGVIGVSTRRDGETVEVVVEDDGCGIRPEHCDRIFDPFFTTKGVGEGTGLGLAISFQIIRAHGAQIHVESELGLGTRFRVRFPAAPG